MTTGQFLIKKLGSFPFEVVPRQSTTGSAGVDLVAAVQNDLTLDPGKRMAVPTGIAIALPPGFEAQVRPRSGLALHHGITVLNSPGTIDSDYRGEIKVILINLGEYPFLINPGDRIAQLVVSNYVQTTWQLTQDLSQTDRNQGGFGHTG